MFHDLITFSAALLAITNPFGNLAIFAGLTADDPPRQRHGAARTAALAVAATLLLILWIGGPLLGLLGVTLPGLQMAGGAILALMGLSMLQSKTSAIVHTPHEHEAAKAKASIAVVPMAIPIVAGPGAMTTVVVAAQHHPGVGERLALSAVCLGVSALIWLALRFAGPIAGRLGVSGINVVTRLTGIVLTAVAFQMLTGGLVAAMPGLGG